MDSYGECTTAQQELDEIELGRQPSHDLRFGQDIDWLLQMAYLIKVCAPRYVATRIILM